MSSPGERIHSLDAVRALAMFLGIFLHAALPYSMPGFPWPVFDQSRSLRLTIVLFVIHAFRMPAFFLVAGFFGRVLHQRLGFRSFIRHRLRRILLPLIAAWLILFPLVRFAWTWGALRTLAGPHSVRFADAFALAFNPRHVAAGLGFAHLWFLYYLLVIYGVFLALRALVLRAVDTDGFLRHRLDKRIASVAAASMELPVLALPTTLLLIPMRTWGVDAPDASLLPQPRSLLLYLAFFSIGWLLARQPALIDSLGRRWLRYPIIAAVALAPLFAMLYLFTRPGALVPFWLRTLYFANYAVVGWALVLALVALCVRFLARPNRFVRYAADASYWMYLVHLPLVLLVGFLLAEIAWPWPVELAIAHIVVVPLLLASYHLFVRSSWIGVFLNGRRLPRLSESTKLAANDVGRLGP